MTKHEYYTYTKEELLNKGAKLPVIVMEDNAAVFQSMAEEMAEEIKKNNAEGNKTVFRSCRTVSLFCGNGKSGKNQSEKCLVY